jgi:protease-4
VPNPFRHLSPAGRRLLLVTALLAVTTGCAPMSFLVTPVPRKPRLSEQVILRESAWTTRKVALVEVDGLITNSREKSLVGTVGENPVAIFTERLNRAASDRNVAAVVLRINSPGGTVTASDLMFAEISRFRAETSKPVVTSMLDVAASGGYYLACGTDKIYAHPTTITGSIGVIMVLPEFFDTMQKIGATVNTIKSGEMKDAGSMFRHMDEDERAYFKHLVDQMYGRFLKVVALGRAPLEPDELRELADGRVFLGPEAKELGLVDELGTMYDAIHAAKELAGIGDKPVKVVRYARPYVYRPNIYAAHDVPPAQVNLIDVGLPEWLRGDSPQMMYLWAPGW